MEILKVIDVFRFICKRDTHEYGVLYNECAKFVERLLCLMDFIGSHFGGCIHSLIF